MLCRDLINLLLRPKEIEVINLIQDKTSYITPRNSKQLLRHRWWDGLLTSLVPFVSHGDDVNDAAHYVENEKGNVLDESGNNFFIRILEQSYSEDTNVLKIVAN